MVKNRGAPQEAKKAKKAKKKKSDSSSSEEAGGGGKDSVSQLTKAFEAYEKLKPERLEKPEKVIQ